MRASAKGSAEELRRRVAELELALAARDSIDWRRIVEQVNDAVIVVDGERRIIYWNPAAEAIYGWRAEEALGANFGELIPVRRYLDGSSYEEVLALALRDDHWSGEVIHPHREGHDLWIDASVRVLRDGSGRVSAMVGINRDITERVRREQAQREAEARAADALRRQLGRLQVLADTSHAFASSERDLDHVVATIVERVAAGIGDSCSMHLLSEDGQQLVPTGCHHPDPEARALMSAIFATAPTRLGVGLGGMVVGDGQSYLLNGLSREQFAEALRDEFLPYYDRYPVHSIAVVPLRTQNKVLGLLAAARDISQEPYTEDDLTLLEDLAGRSALALENARLHASQRATAERLTHAFALLDTLFASAPIGLAFVDDGLRFVRVNAKLAEFIGLPMAAYAGRRVSEVIPDYYTPLEPIYRHVLERGEAVTDVEMRAGEQPEHSRFWLASYYPVRLSDGPPIGVGVVAVEITAMKRSAAALSESAAEMRSLSQRLVEVQEAERRHIARELHDEVGQTLTGLDIMLEMISRAEPELIPPTLETARRYVRDLSQVVRRISLDLRPSMLDDLGLVPSLLWLYNRFSGQTGVQVRFHHDGAERRFAPVVETTAYRMIQEALTNVARYARVGSVDVQLMADDETLQIQIEDAGIGFDPAAVSSGVSSGLAGMRERASLLGGQIAVESAPGRGTLILVELPLGLRPAARAEEAHPR